MKTIDYDSQEEITNAIEDLSALAGPWEAEEGEPMWDLMRAHNPGQHIALEINIHREGWSWEARRSLS